MCSDVKNNHNKFYIIQILQHALYNTIHYWNRYGRVGEDGVSDLTGTMAENEAIS
jgi:predicted DNA-binding WGR domain protein